MSNMDEEGDRFSYHEKGHRPGEEPDPPESPAGGSQGAADIGARGTAAGGRYAEDRDEGDGGDEDEGGSAA